MARFCSGVGPGTGGSCGLLAPAAGSRSCAAADRLRSCDGSSCVAAPRAGEAVREFRTVSQGGLRQGWQESTRRSPRQICRSVRRTSRTTAPNGAPSSPLEAEVSDHNAPNVKHFTQTTRLSWSRQGESEAVPNQQQGCNPGLRHWCGHAPADSLRHTRIAVMRHGEPKNQAPEAGCGSQGIRT